MKFFSKFLSLDSVQLIVLIKSKEKNLTSRNQVVFMYNSIIFNFCILRLQFGVHQQVLDILHIRVKIKQKTNLLPKSHLIES